VCKEVFGEKESEETPDIPESVIKAKPSKGKAYMMYDRVGKWVTGPFVVKKMYTFDGTTKLDIYKYWSNETHTIKLNPDYDKNDYQACVFGTDMVGWIEIAADFDRPSYEGADHDSVNFKEMDVNVGDEKDVSMAIDFHAGYKEASVVCKTDNDFMLKYNGYLSPEITHVGMVAFLMKEACVSQGEAEYVVEQAANTGSSTFFCKIAKKLTLDAFDPKFYHESLNEFGVMEDDRCKTQVIEADSGDNWDAYFNKTVMEHGEGNVDKAAGDAKNEPLSAVNRSKTKMKVASAMAMPEEQVQALMESGTPQEMADYAQSTGDRGLFEHGVVGQLVKTYDAADMITQYVPDLVQALDKIGRTLFLLYWRPEDFAERYGADDQTELENMLLSTFKQYGDLVLELLKRNPDVESKVVAAN
jgi:hypothetical protein